MADFLICSIDLLKRDDSEIRFVRSLNAEVSKDIFR